MAVSGAGRGGGAGGDKRRLEPRGRAKVPSAHLEVSSCHSKRRHSTLYSMRHTPHSAVATPRFVLSFMPPPMLYVYGTPQAHMFRATHHHK